MPPCPGSWQGQVVYPEVYYKIQPFIIQACIQVEINGMPLNQDMMDRMGDGVYHDVCQVYPELAEYSKCPERGPRRTSFSGMQFGAGGFRRRGLLRDLIDILLLYELFGRRRSY